VVLAASIAVGWLILLPDDFVRLGKQVIASAAFMANFYFWLQSGYFSPDAHTFPLLHLWSLGVEEQFYIAWPILIVLLRTRTRWIVAIAIFGTVSFMLSVALADHREFDFYSPFTRAWELMFGAVLAWCQRNRRSAAWAAVVADSATVIGLTLIWGSVFALNQSEAFPGWRALFPVMGAALVISGGRSRVGSIILANSFFVLIGLVSYPLYLWHWPLLVLYTAFKFAPPTLVECGLVVLVSFGLAWLTYEFVEKPIRSGRFHLKQIPRLTVAMGVAAIAGVVIVLANGFENRFPIEALAFSRKQPTAWRLHQCLLDLTAGETTFGEGCIETKRPLFAVWGDSTAAALMPGLRDIQQTGDGIGLAQLTSSNCAPASNASTPVGCRQVNKAVLQTLRRIRPDLVLLHASGPLNDETMGGWKETIAGLKLMQAPRVVVIGPVPAWKRGLPGQMLHFYITHRSLLPQRSSEFVYDIWDEKAAKAFFSAEGVEYVSAWDILCNADGCLARLSENGAITTIDRHHLTEEGSIFLIRSISNRLFASPAVER
jgi:peptidoglycan/LPS O-acetylase OafA/YrhL